MSERAPSPIACRMDALTAAERTRRAEILATLRQRATSVAETPDGIVFHLRGEADTPALVGEFIGYESRCCPFLSFDLAVDAEGGPARLSLGGRDEARDFLRATFLDSSRDE
jgi:hypothetical protein